MIYYYFYVSCVLLHVSLGHYTHQWAVHVLGGKDVADQLAKDHGFKNLGQILPNYYHFQHPRIAKRSPRPNLEKKTSLSLDTRVIWAEQQVAKKRIKRDYKLQDSDPRWPSMWYLNRGNGLDMNVIPAWLDGITGKGAVVTILDDGLEKDHPDLSQNYDPMASYDVNDQDSDPSPRYDMIDSNRHGTRCAGEVAAVSNNSICALGVAHGAQVGGVRMLDGDVTDAVEARSLSYNPQHIDIYSASWGPDDDGKTVDGPGELATRAFIEGVTRGRNGKGSVFVWASGNGGRDHDNCNCDGYTNSIYTLSISSATEQGRVPWYSEACSSTLASTYSSGAADDKQVVTTDLHHSCTSSHTGTSASAPLAAGICALALEANPNLTWRDMQHIVVRTARPQNLVAPDWKINGVGRNVSHSFGYGLMDAYAMVQLAKRWITVPEQHKCEISAPHVQKVIPAKSVVILQLEVTECQDVKVLEHVQAKLTISSHRRGDLRIQLTSPMGTKVTLLAHRANDLSKTGFNHWPFMSVHSWGESPLGIWQLEIHNDDKLLGRAVLQNWSLVLYGTKQFISITEQTGYNKNFRIRTNSKKKINKKQKKIKNSLLINKTKLKTKNNITSQTFLSPSLVKNKNVSTSSTTISNFLLHVRSKNSSSLIDFKMRPYWKFVKNISITYPIMIPLSRGTISRDSLKKNQKPKEKSRDLNHSNKTFKQKIIETTTKTEILTDKGKTDDAEIHAWDLILYGTSTPPAADSNIFKDYKSTITNTFQHNSLDEPNESVEIRKDISNIENLTSAASSRCSKSNEGFCIDMESFLQESSTECSVDYILHEGKCLKECPEAFYLSSLEDVENFKQYNNGEEKNENRVCLACHYTCKTCIGPNDYQCKECFPDATLTNFSKWEFYCFPSYIIVNLNAQKWYFRVYILLWIILSGLFIAMIVFVIKRRRRKNLNDFDVITTIRGIEKNVKSAVYSDSDGE